jgi:hypothetical protein
MARIAGVDLPRNKRMEIALTYVYGIGRSAAVKICAEAQVDPGRKSDDLTDEEGSRIRRRGEHQAAGRPRMLPRHPPPAEPPRSRAADAHQRADAEGTAARHPGQEGAAAEGLELR